MSTLLKNSKQIKIFDIAKGLSIILMTLVHYPFTQSKSVYPKLSFLLDHVLMLFIVPIFIFVSGYFLSERLSFKAFLISKLEGLLKPVLGFLLSLTFLKIVFYLTTTNGIAFNDLKIYITNLVSVFVYGDFGFVNYALWFVGGLFWAQIFLKWIVDFNNSRNIKKTRVVFFVLFFIVTIILNYKQSRFYYIGFVPPFLVYLSLGYIFKKNSNDYLKGVSILYSGKMVIFPVLFFVLTYVFYQLNINTKLDLNLFEFNYHFMLFVSVVGIFSVLFISTYLEKVHYLSALLTECSKSSFFILGYHIFVIDIYKCFFDLETSNPILHLILFVLNIAICYMVYKVLIRIPFLRFLFFPLRKIKLSNNEVKFLKSKYVSRFIPSEILDLSKL